MSPVFDCFSFARSGNQADVRLNYKYKQCHQSLGPLGKCIIWLVWQDLALKNYWQSWDNSQDSNEGWIRCKLALPLQYAVPLPLVEVEMASDDTNQNKFLWACNMLQWFSTSFWPETAMQSALHVSCVWLLLFCEERESSRRASQLQVQAVPSELRAPWQVYNLAGLARFGTQKLLTILG